MDSTRRTARGGTLDRTGGGAAPTASPTVTGALPTRGRGEPHGELAWPRGERPDRVRGPRVADELVVEGGEGRDVAIHRVGRRRPCPTRGAESRPLRRVGGERGDGTGERRRISARHEHAAAVRAERFGVPRDVGGDHGHAERLRLEDA